jgi:hypothetical protein
VRDEFAPRLVLPAALLLGQALHAVEMLHAIDAYLDVGAVACA